MYLREWTKMPTGQLSSLFSSSDGKQEQYSYGSGGILLVMQVMALERFYSLLRTGPLTWVCFF